MDLEEVFIFIVRLVRIRFFCFVCSFFIRFSSLVLVRFKLVARFVMAMMLDCSLGVGTCMFIYMEIGIGLAYMGFYRIEMCYFSF